ncbi:MAG: thiamine phosphate synthase [Bacteroides sp.]|nr:thiamine phosphate synthase [Bacteroides sp.]
MKLIVITPETIYKEEPHAINRLFETGLYSLHLRKPGTSQKEMADLLKDIELIYRKRVIIHDHFELTSLYGLKGIHLNKRNSIIPAKMDISSISCSCHSFEEVKLASKLDYVFLSPVFDSISKPGYNQAFSDMQLKKAQSEGIINSHVIALGGISPVTIPLAAGYGFRGVAVLGSLWQRFETDRDVSALIRRFKELKSICEKL